MFKNWLLTLLDEWCASLRSLSCALFIALSSSRSLSYALLLVLTLSLLFLTLFFSRSFSHTHLLAGELALWLDSIGTQGL